MGSAKFGNHAAHVAGQLVAGGRLAPAEAERAPVWLALSEFWLDTEQSDDFMDTLVEVVAATPFTTDELRRIHSREVSPAVWHNVLDMAGEWAGFDAEWLFLRCAENARRSGSLRATVTRALRSPFVHFFTRAKLEDLLSRVEQRRGGRHE
jgi:hypothetical protein